MDHLPVFVNLKDKPCLIVGGGAVAERKAQLLLRSGARVRIVAPTVTGTLASWHAEGRVERLAATFDDSLPAGHRLLVAATDDTALNARVARAADAAGVLCNVVDDNARSSFILPAIVDRSPVTVAIGTGGRAPVLAQKLKSQLEARLPARIGELAERAGRWRELVKRRFATLDERRRFWQRFFEGPVAGHILAGRRRRAEDAMRRELIDRAPPADGGSASIVGAGPGDPGLVTLKAQQLLGEADVVLYDRLVSDAVLDMARKEAELIPVGKAAGGGHVSQDEINALLVENVRAGRRVCRLKGGDPFVFGRGAEEARALAEAGLPYQVVPGISAALGCAAYAGIPLTLRHVSAGVTLATARLDTDAAPDWQGLARRGQTLAFYMSVGALDTTAAQLIGHGLRAETPAALVENGTTARQRVLHAPLSRIAAEARRRGVAAPAMLFIGEAVAEARRLAWFEPADDAESGTFPNTSLAGAVARSA